MKTIALKSIILSLSAILLFVFASKAQYIQFVENRGQWDARVNYAGQINGGGFFIEKNGYRVSLNSSSDWQKIADYYGGHSDSTTLAVLKSNGKSWQTQNATKAVASNNANNNLILHSHAYEVTFVNASTSPETAPDKALNTYNNYFIGNDKSKWTTGCKIYGAVVYKNMYPNIDVRYYTANSQLKYDIIVHPGGDISQIAMRFDGTNGLRIKRGDLLVSTSFGDVTELSPESYQTSATAKTNVNCKLLAQAAIQFVSKQIITIKTLHSSLIRKLYFVPSPEVRQTIGVIQPLTMGREIFMPVALCSITVTQLL